MSAGESQLVAEMAAWFWAETGGWPGATADLPRAAALSLPLDVVSVGRLRLSRVEGWLADRGMAYRFGEADRALHGLLVVYRGAGAVFLDGSDPEAERRFTLAHEVAHFLLDYVRPRERAAARLGAGIVDVLNGDRPPTVEERVAGVLAGVDVFPFVHLLARNGEDGSRPLAYARAESRADALACELLAPATEVSETLRRAGVGRSYFPCVSAAQTLLRGPYGLPEGAADLYARRLARGLTGGASLVSSLAGK